MRLTRILIIVATTMVLFSQPLLLAETNEPYSPGRYLEDGNWQARNTRATQQEPRAPEENPFDIFTEWGTDIRLSYTEGLRIHDPEIAAYGNYVYVTWWNVEDHQVDLARSTDLGATWQPQVRISDTLDNYTSIPQITAEDSCAYVVYTVGASRVWLAKSTDHGQIWSRGQIYGAGRNTGGGATIAARDSQLYCVFAILVDYVPPTNSDLFMYGSNDYGETWPDTFFVSDTTFSGIGPELAINRLERQPDPVLHLIRQASTTPNTEEILYQRSIDGGQTWLGPAIISDRDTIHSQWPQITAWGDLNVIATWMDYKYSDQQFNGDAFVSKSTDNGETWSTPMAMTSSHLVKSSDIASCGDTLVLAYHEGLEGPSTIYVNISFDGGATWQGEYEVNDDTAVYRLEPTVAAGGGYAHVAWSDGRDAGFPGLVEAYYDRAHLDTTETGMGGSGSGCYPSPISLSAYPNPFNSSISITLSNLYWKGGDYISLTIFDITGRKVKEFNLKDAFRGGEVQINWDATDASGKSVSSGVYFARVSTPQTSKTIKLLLLR